LGALSGSDSGDDVRLDALAEAVACLGKENKPGDPALAEWR
jgi:hypothetical protein